MTPNLNALSFRTAAAARAAITAVALLTWADGAAAQTAAPPQAPAPAATATPSASATTGTVEIGAGNVSEGSFKAGEYNGLQKKGAFGIAALDFRGGGAYDSTSAFRWRVKGTDLGLDTRNLAAEAGVQGKYRVTFGYDSLLRNRSDSYQTPY